MAKFQEVITILLNRNFIFIENQKRRMNLVVGMGESVLRQYKFILTAENNRLYHQHYNIFIINIAVRIQSFLLLKMLYLEN